MSGNPETKKRTLGGILNSFAENLLFVLFSAMIIIVFINVVARYVFNSSIVESEELARYCFIWSSLIGAVFALNNNEHIGVDILVKKFSPRGQKVLLVIANVFILVLTVICTIYGYILAESTFGWPSPATRIPYGIIGLIIPISFFAMSIIIVKNTIKILRRKL
ncbi:MAG TPA: TRAP transporter small permease [Spirochaetales bacterium]|nr:TRAP transporter small permease [Spirochaetales bacterium]HOV38384.1 TRAP transporter small permease [Spirochaetales bacterium]